MNLKVKFKKLIEHAFTPTYSHEGDACLDLYSVDQGYYNPEYKFTEYGTGLTVEIPENYIGLVFPRSSISKTPHYLSNSVGVIDSNYRGEIKLRFRNHMEGHEFEYHDFEYGFGDRIGQLLIIPRPKIELEEVDELSDSPRGENGFGSTGE